MPAQPLELRSPMRRSVYIQRLLRPLTVTNRFTHRYEISGGEILGDVNTLFTCDYMGQIEFERGAVPAALRFLREQAAKGGVTSGTHRDVFYIAPLFYEDGVKIIIDRLLKDEWSMGLAEYCGLSACIQYVDKAAYRGWLEIDNGFMLFIDQEMFEKTKQWLGL